ncbi:hypothetical protein VIA_001518 [Vibrio orientalis CIP 102891 = ATCC 33934]|uniref:Uncharacterized protein n=1 Tax=Vibrio orientalis CIP 102891 = ATCC 33934 TaxID=675816 RepID=A0ABM9Z3U6_VIBOR|nr:hypothetical protein VIA_001518 [Vibrio orientalis CIP 102891 = ATCC 33934]
MQAEQKPNSPKWHWLTSCYGLAKMPKKRARWIAKSVASQSKKREEKQARAVNSALIVSRF